MATRNVPPQQGQSRTRGTTTGQSAHGNKFADAGAFAGGLLGAMGGSFVPPINLTVNSGGGRGG
ncbi:sporulation protein SsgA, partial [Streptomyces sp. NPDC056294]